MKAVIDNLTRVKTNGAGRATPLNKETYQLISDQLLSESHKLFWGFAWYTGMKPDAILHIDVAQAYRNVELSLPRLTLKRKDACGEMPLHRNLQAILKDFRPPRSGFLFPSLYRDGEHLSRQAIDKAFRRAAKKAGLVGDGYSLLSPRWGFILRLDELGYSQSVIESIICCKLPSLCSNRVVTAEKMRDILDSF